MKENPAMKKIQNLAEQFAKRIKRLMKGYSEGRILFVQYIENSLKANSRKQRGDSETAVFKIHKEMNIMKVSLKGLLSASSTKAETNVCI